MKKTIFALLLTILLTPLALAAFSDVSETHDNVIAINYLQQEGIIGGYPDGTFRPDNSINRAEMMKILVEGQGITPDENEFNNCFPDVGTEWFAKYVCYAKQQNWVNGYPDGTFRPANNVLDVEAMKMILNAAGIELDANFSPQKFAAVPSDAWYRPYLLTAEKLNLTESFTPGNDYSRAEVSEVIFRTIVIKETSSDVYSVEARGKLLNPVTEETPTEEEPAAENVAVAIQGFRFVPANITINVGDTVTWTNNDTATHTATMEGVFDSGGLEKGESWSFTFTEPGTYDYICTIHPSMQGQVIVE